MNVVYGATCSWWDTIDKVSRSPSGLPCCPHCRGVLFQDDETNWNKAIAAFAERTKDENYPKFMTWARGKCFKSFKVAREAFDKELAGA